MLSIAYHLSTSLLTYVFFKVSILVATPNFNVPLKYKCRIIDMLENRQVSTLFEHIIVQSHHNAQIFGVKSHYQTLPYTTTLNVGD